MNINKRMLVRKRNKNNAVLCRLLLIMTALCASFNCVYADIIKLKNGGSVEGIIFEESEGDAVVEIKFGKITFNKNDIECIEKASDDYNNSLRERWKIEKNEIKKELAVIKPQAESRSTKPKADKIQPVAQSAQPAILLPQRKAGEIKLIKCEDNIHSYAVCLPSDYEKRGDCPVLFCFDPGADGAQAARRLAFAAEKYGWIVAGSLNAQNGPWEPILKAQSAMLSDISDRYKTNNKKYYAAGFSGGARMSYTMAYNHPSKFKGVIACGAGFGQGAISKKVAIYNCVGGADSNLKEVKDAHAELSRKGVKTELNVFPGGHDWPPDIILKQAVDWIAKN